MDGQPAREFDRLEAAQDLAEGVGKRLAVVAGDQRRKLLTVAIDEFPIGEEDPTPRHQRHVAPGRECPAGGGDGSFDLGCPTTGHPSDHEAGGGIVDGSSVLGVDLDRAAVDPVAQDRGAHVFDRVGYLRSHD